MTIVNLPSVIGAKSLEDVIDAVENMRKTVEYLLENVQDDNINGVISPSKIQIGDTTIFAEGFDPDSIIANANGYTDSMVSGIQTDGQVDTWFYDGVPTLNNAPASSWTDTTKKDAHLDDLYYDTSTGKAYRFKVVSGVYSWGLLQDQDIQRALTAASGAQDTADHKRRIFVTIPTPPYDVGDLWAGGSNGDLKHCITAKTSGQSYAAEDWAISTKYTSVKGTYIDETGVYTGNLVADQIKTGKLTSIELSSVTGDFAGKLSADVLTVEPPNGNAAIMKFKAGLAGVTPQYVTFAGNVVTSTDMSNNVTYSSSLDIGKNWNSTQEYMSSNIEVLGFYANDINFYGRLYMNNHNIEDVNHITINDTGPYEGIEWLGGSGWVIHETDDNALYQGSYPLQFNNNNGRMVTFGTTGNIYCTGTMMKIQGNQGYFKSDGSYTLLHNDANGAEFGVGSDGRTRVFSNDIYSRTYTSTSSMVPCYVTTAGTLGILSSALRYKTDVQEIPMDMPDKILNLVPKSWHDLAAIEAYSDYLAETSPTNIDGTPNTVAVNALVPDYPDVDERGYGLIAEELEAAGLSEFVIYEKDENGNKQTKSIAYDRLWTLLIPIVRDLKTRVSALENPIV